MNLIYILCTGGAVSGKSFESQMIYSLLSLHHVASPETKQNIRIIIYTDINDVFCFPPEIQSFRIEVEVIEPLMIRKWMAGSNGYFFIVKPRLLHHALLKYRSPCIAIDSDTFFVRDPLDLFRWIAAGNTLLHIREHGFTFRSELCKYLAAKVFIKRNGRDEYTISTGLDMWNAGVVGLDHSHLGLLVEVIHLTEYISNDIHYPKAEWYFPEQLSFCYFLQNDKRLLSADPYIIHYWFLKPFKYLLAHFFDHFHGNDREELFRSDGITRICADDIPRAFTYGELPQILLSLTEKYYSLRILAENVSPGTYLGGQLEAYLTIGVDRRG